jgi:hypothetical protein
MEEKICNICKGQKGISEFNKSSQHKSGFRNYCKKCQKEMSFKYKERLGDELKNKKKKWQEENKEKVKESRRKTYLKHGKRISREKYQRTKSSPVKYLKMLMRRRILGILNSKNMKKKLKCESIVGCSYSDLKLHLESKFQPDMTWENQGDWHIDHIIPLSSAQTEDEIYRLCHYTNLQPLWAEDNLKKGNKIIQTLEIKHP